MKKTWSAKMGVMMISLICIMFYIFQWNVRCLTANGQDFNDKTAKERKGENRSGGGCSTEVKPELECVVREVWTNMGKITVDNLYNPHSILEEIITGNDE